MSRDPGLALCVVVHDVADETWPACLRLIDAIDEVAPLPLTLLAVPRYHGRPASAALERWLGMRLALGDELALHGFVHQDDGAPRDALDWLRRRVYTRGEGEFAALPFIDAAWRLSQGEAWFLRNGWPLQGFVAPAWLMGNGAWQALLRSPSFQYTATLGRLHLLRERRSFDSRALVYSSQSAWRRGASVAWAACNARLLARNAVLRIELHPRDADHASVRRSWQKILARALGQRTPTTLGAWTQRWRQARRAALAQAARRRPPPDDA
ncbi:MAG: polysaccharide deacetylase family protein [Burkholderiaceae bacterium]